MHITISTLSIHMNVRGTRAEDVQRCDGLIDRRVACESHTGLSTLVCHGENIDTMHAPRWMTGTVSNG